MKIATVSTTLATALGVVAAGLGAFTAFHQRREARVRRSHAQPEPLARWEDEGGNVPAANLGTRDARDTDA
jgi:hypothetical protein